jgi:hypothetical protein
VNAIRKNEFAEAVVAAQERLKHPLAVSDPNIRLQLQLAGLRFMCSRARWLESEATKLGLALKSGEMTSDQVDEKLDEMGALDLVYPDLMGCDE